MKSLKPVSFRLITILSVSILAALACNLPSGAADPTRIVPTAAVATDDIYTEPPPLFPTVTPPTQAEQTSIAMTSTPPQGPRVEYQGVSFEVKPSVFSAALGTIAPMEEGEAGMRGWPGPVPEYYRFDFQGYPLTQPWIAPQILVYPIQEYAAVNPPAGEIAAKLDSLLRVVEVSLDSQPFLPMWNAGPVFYARPQVINFQNGKGIRYLTCFAQSFVPIDTSCLFYTFQALTADGRYYISAIFPIDLPALHTSDAEAKWNAAMTDITSYQQYVTEMAQQLASASAVDFTPDLNNLDNLVKSLSVNPSVVLKAPPIPTFSCPGAMASQLKPSSRARVTFTDGTPLRVREGPGKTAKIIKTIPEGTEMFIMEGPECGDQGVWWRMQTNNGSVAGWVMEGENGSYYIEPWN
jgi:hypothetical protein